jgi:hypothetical protein
MRYARNYCSRKIVLWLFRHGLVGLGLGFMNVAAALLFNPQTLLLWLMILGSGCGNVCFPWAGTVLPQVVLPRGSNGLNCTCVTEIHFRE